MVVQFFGTLYWYQVSAYLYQATAAGDMFVPQTIHM